MQAFDAVFAEFGVQWLTPIIGIMLVAASLGGMLTWLAGPSKGLLLISRQEGYLPPFLQKLNKNGVQQNILVTQGIVTTVIAPGLRADPVRLERLLDLLGHHHAGLPDHVPADVRRGGPSAPQRPRPPARLPRADARCCCAASASPPRSRPCSSASSRRRSSSRGQPGVYLADRRAAGARPRPARAVPLLPAAQALVEAAGASRR